MSVDINDSVISRIDKKPDRPRFLGYFVALILSCTGHALASEDWEDMRKDADLSALFSDTTMTAILNDGVEATSVYNSDGSGVLKAWGGSFKREWKIEDGNACLLIDESWQCFDVQQNSTSPTQYRAISKSTGDIVVFNVQAPHLLTTQSLPGANGGAVAPSADEVAKKLANPNTPLATITMRTQFRGFEGDLPKADSQNSTTVLLQPSFPFPVSDDSVVYFRPAIPLLINRPVFESLEDGFGEETGIGDIAFDLGYGVTNKETGVLLAGGMVSTLPTATDDDLGADRFTLGPELLVGLLGENYVLGAFPNHQWDVAGSGDKEISTTSAQFFGIALPGGGWNIGTAPIISYDWKADDWTVPVQLDIGKTVIWKGRPWKLGIEFNYYVEKPDAFGPKWMVGVNIGPVVENVMASWFN